MGPAPAPASYCSACGGELTRCGGCGSPFDPLRFCGVCGRRLAVQVTPTGWTATCRACDQTVHG